MDRQVQLRSIFVLAVAALFGLAALSPVSRPFLWVALIVPATFGLVALGLLSAPFLAMEHAEGELPRWRTLVDFLEHNSLLGFVDLMVLLDVALVAGFGWADQGVLGRVLYVAAVATGAGSALGDWFLGQQTDRKQRGWQRHPPA